MRLFFSPFFSPFFWIFYIFFFTLIYFIFNFKNSLGSELVRIRAGAHYARDDLMAHGYGTALEAVADTERAKYPKLQRRASSAFYGEPIKTRGLDQRLLMLFEYMFQMFCPDCGSIARDTYDKDKFLGALAKECEELHGKVVFKM